jgi:hypothetical protein
MPRRQTVVGGNDLGDTGDQLHVGDRVRALGEFAR